MTRFQPKIVNGEIVFVADTNGRWVSAKEVEHIVKDNKRMRRLLQEVRLYAERNGVSDK